MTDADATGTHLAFPDGFIWGAATSAHQIEGGNTNNDWWTWEHNPGSGCAESSGDACDSFNRWPEDLDLCAGMGLGAYRFSLEWSRIEPAEGEFSIAALDHYRRICTGCHERGLTPIVTFHHFTTPQWLADRGGWESPDAPECFARFCTRAARHLGDVIGWGCTICEPNVVAVLGYVKGIYPPGAQDEIARYLDVNQTLVRAHQLGVEAIRSASPVTFPLGLTLSMDEMHADEGGEGFRDAAEEILENTFLRATEGNDFIGVQSYTRIHFGPDGEAPNDPAVPLTQMGCENWPAALGHTVRRAAAMTGLPVFVTENGIATANDAERIAYLHASLQGLHAAMADGIDVRGYLVWSLLDNFEWNQGYAPTFGLHAVDRETFARTPKPSAGWLGDVARANALLPIPAVNGGR